MNHSHLIQGSKGSFFLPLPLPSIVQSVQRRYFLDADWLLDSAEVRLLHHLRGLERGGGRIHPHPLSRVRKLADIMSSKRKTF